LEARMRDLYLLEGDNRQAFADVSRLNISTLAAVGKLININITANDPKVVSVGLIRAALIQQLEVDKDKDKEKDEDKDEDKEKDNDPDDGDNNDPDEGDDEDPDDEDEDDDDDPKDMYWN
jgi:hypothetical protein